MELEQKLNSKFCCKFFSIPYAPYIIDRGSKLRFNYQNADGSEVHFDVDLFPKKLDKKSCDSNSIFYIWPRDVRFRVEFCARNDEQIKDVKAGRQRHGIENENRALRNAAHNKICEFEFQTSLLDELECVIYSKLARACEFFSNNRSFILDHILIVGPEFAGKTSLLHFLADRIFRKNAIFSAQINCIEWRGRSTDTILRRLRATFSTLCARAPSVLLLDDFDALNFESVNADEAQIRIKQLIYSKIVAEIQSHIIHCASAVVLICTTQQEINLPTCAKSWEGRRLFSHSFQISSIKKQEQAKILAQLLNALSIKSWTHAFDAHADLTVGELCALANQIRLTKLNDEELHVGTISTALARRSLTQPIDLLCSRDASLQFDVIGGLTNVKQRLIEIFVWPIKYPQLFAKCGITLGARAILYGPSGCGKTILLRALAAECGENFRSIHVRGPELLSKYIGESEANVRSLFARARVARPCILALDEFDALVPSRGHDNTGVTDRVVNQFLTELDGVENCVKSGDDGVFVIAATNRIELIDRALLRPGRFDHNIFVGHPTQLEEFVDILRIHTSDVRLADELDLNVLALKCLDSNETTWNGASLRAWILNAKFYALNELKKCNESQSDQCMNSGKEFISKTSNNDMAARELVLRMQHFDAVFHASLPKKTLAHASADYFTKNGSHNDDQNPKSKQIEKRVTLA